MSILWEYIFCNIFNDQIHQFYLELFKSVGKLLLELMTFRMTLSHKVCKL